MQSPISERQKLVVACVGLVALNFALQARVLGFGFVDFDDTTVLLAHPNLYDPTSLVASMRQIFVEAFPREEPLLFRDLSWAVDARLFGLQNPIGFHLGNILLNAANAVLLYLFLARATGRATVAWIAAGLFSLLPVHVEPVAWVMGRKDLLSAFWLLAALVIQTFELSESDRRHRRVLYLATLLCTCLALLSKIAAMTAFVVLALHRIFHADLAAQKPSAPRFEWRQALRQVFPSMLPHAVVSVGIVVWYQRVVKDFGVIGWRGPGPLDPGHLEFVATFSPLVIGRYLRSILFPSEFSAYYRWPHVEIQLAPIEIAAAIAMAVLLISVVLYTCLRRRDLAFFVLSFLALLAPYLGFVYVDIWSADRYVYLASFAVVAAGTLLASELYATAGSAPRALLVGVLMLFALMSGVKTIRQQSAWRDTDSLWRHEASLEEPSLLAIQAVARSLVDAAEQSEDPKVRRQEIEQAKLQIERGFLRERELGRRPTAYATSEQLQLARLHSLLGRLAGIEGGSLEVQIAHHSTANQIAPNRATAYRLAELYLALARQAPEPKREPMARRSLEFFLQYVEQSGRDPHTLEQNLARLNLLYERPYPVLREQILASLRTLTP